MASAKQTSIRLRERSIEKLKLIHDELGLGQTDAIEKGIDQMAEIARRMRRAEAEAQKAALRKLTPRHASKPRRRSSVVVKPEGLAGIDGPGTGTPTS
jgi:hypothetical protein